MDGAAGKRASAGEARIRAVTTGKREQVSVYSLAERFRRDHRMGLNGPHSEGAVKM